MKNSKNIQKWRHYSYLNNRAHHAVAHWMIFGDGVVHDFEKSEKIQNISRWKMIRFSREKNTNRKFFPNFDAN